MALLFASFSLLALTSAFAATAGPSATLVFNQSEQYSIYTSVGISLHANGDPTFAVGDGLNAPEFVEVYDSAGSLSWSFSAGSGTYMVSSSRHIELAPAGSIDTFVAVLLDAGGTMLYGFASDGTGTPAWNISLPDCSSDTGGGTYIGLDASDSGNRLAFLCHYSGSGGKPTARVYLIGGQSGRVTWMQDLGSGVQAGQGDVQITASGSFVLFVNEQGVPTPNTAEAFIFEGATGVLRDNITIPFFITASISDSGDYVVVGDDPAAHVWMFDTSSNKYKPAYDLTPPSGPAGWIPWDIQMGTGTDAQEMVVIGYISGTVLTVQVTAWSLLSQQQLTNWVSPTNSKLQENPSLRTDGAYIGVSLWGDSGEAGYPTVVLLSAGSDTPVFNFTSPGSMFTIDVAVQSSSAAQDTVLLSAGGKAVPANEFGNGGNAYGWLVTIPKP